MDFAARVQRLHDRCRIAAVQLARRYPRFACNLEVSKGPLTATIMVTIYESTPLDVLTPQPLALELLTLSLSISHRSQEPDVYRVFEAFADSLVEASSEVCNVAEPAVWPHLCTRAKGHPGEHACLGVTWRRTTD